MANINNLLSFYRSFLESIGIYINKDGYLTDSDEKIITGITDIPFKLPTEEALKHVMVRDESRAKSSSEPYVQQYEIYNPLNEMAILGGTHTPDILLTAKYLSDKYSTLLHHAVGEVINGLGKEDVAENNEAVELLLEVSSRVRGGKDVIDKSSYKNVNKIFNSMFTDDNGQYPLSFMVSKGGTIDGEKYNRIISVSVNIYRHIHENDYKALRVRSKDVILLDAILQHIFSNMSESGIILVGSKSKTSPSFDGLVEAADIIGNMIASASSFIDDADVLKEIIAEDRVVERYKTSKDTLIREAKMIAPIRHRQKEKNLTQKRESDMPSVPDTPPTPTTPTRENKKDPRSFFGKPKEDPVIQRETPKEPAKETTMNTPSTPQQQTQQQYHQQTQPIQQQYPQTPYPQQTMPYQPQQTQQPYNPTPYPQQAPLYQTQPMQQQYPQTPYPQQTTPYQTQPMQQPYQQTPYPQQVPLYQTQPVQQPYTPTPYPQQTMPYQTQPVQQPYGEPPLKRNASPFGRY